NQAANVVLVRIDQRVGYNLVQGHVGQSAFRCHALLLRAGRNPGQLVAGLFFVGAGGQCAHVGHKENLTLEGLLAAPTGPPLAERVCYSVGPKWNSQTKSDAMKSSKS